MATEEQLDRRLAGYMAVRVWEDADSLLAARVGLGTASLSERLRYWLGLGASKKARERTERMNRLRAESRRHE